MLNAKLVASEWSLGEAVAQGLCAILTRTESQALGTGDEPAAGPAAASGPKGKRFSEASGRLHGKTIASGLV